jgi:hypothetical protein
MQRLPKTVQSAYNLHMMHDLVFIPTPKSFVMAWHPDTIDHTRFVTMCCDALPRANRILNYVVLG